MVLTDGLVALLDSFGLGQAGLLGSLLAGCWLQSFGTHHPAHVAAMVLANTFCDADGLRQHPKGFEPLPLRWRIEATFGTLSNRYRRLTRNLEQSPAAAEDAVSIANCHRLLRAHHHPGYSTVQSNRLSMTHATTPVLAVLHGRLGF